MKKFSLAITLIALSWAIFYTVGCKKENSSSIPVTKTKSIKSMADLAPSSYGTYHNLAVNNTMSYWYDNYSTFDPHTEMQQMISALIANDPIDLASLSAFDLSSIEATDQYKSMIAHRTDVGSTLNTDIQNELTYLKNSGTISSTLYTDLSNTFDVTDTYENMDSKLNAIDPATLSTTDQNQLAVVVSVFGSSHNLWYNWNNNQPLATAKWTNGHSAIALDAVYTLGFWASGPGALIVGALASIAYLD